MVISVAICRDCRRIRAWIPTKGVRIGRVKCRYCRGHVRRMTPTERGVYALEIRRAKEKLERDLTE